MKKGEIMHKKKMKPKYIFIIIIILVITIIAIFSHTLKEDRELNRFESLVKDTVTSIEKVIFYPFRFVINKVDDYKELKDIRKQEKDNSSDLDFDIIELLRDKLEYKKCGNMLTCLIISVVS